jgi:hypothetical protein
MKSTKARGHPSSLSPGKTRDPPFIYTERDLTRMRAGDVSLGREFDCFVAAAAPFESPTEGLRSVRKAFEELSQKIQKSSKSVLTVRRAPDYIRLTNEGGAPLATREFALVKRNSREPRERHSIGPEAKSEPAHDNASAMSVL